MRPPIDTAMILAAGRGQRMRPLTDSCPKPLLRVAGRTMLDRVLDHLDSVSVTRRVINTHWLGEQVHAHVSGRPGIVFSDEAALLETGGGVAKALPLLGSAPFFVCNADMIWTNGPVPALARLSAAWQPDVMDALLLLQPTERAFGYDGAGDFFLTDDGRPHRRGSAQAAPLMFAGIQILHPALFADIPEGPFSLNLLYDRAAAAGRLRGLVHDGDWYHIGTPAALAAAEPLLAGS